MSNSIRERREAAGWSQQDLARESGVSRSLIAAVERGMALGPKSQAKLNTTLARGIEAATKRLARARRISAKAVEAAPAA